MTTQAIFVTADRGTKRQDEQAQAARDSKPIVRRPTNGIQPKEDTFATLTVRFLQDITKDGGGSQQLIDAGSRRTDADGNFLGSASKRMTDIYANFLIQSVTQQRDEKQQILETFGDPYIFFFGQRARILQFQGVLLNTFDFNWRQEWLENYETYLRGTKCVENDARVYLTYDDTLVSGYIINTSEAVNSENRNHVPFSFSLFVTGYSSIHAPGNPNVLPNSTPTTIQAGPSSLNDPGRPTLISDNRAQNMNPFAFPTSGFDADEFFYGQLTKTITQGSFKSISSVVNNTLKSINNVLNGTVVSIPHGFAGELVFYDDVYARAIAQQTNARDLASASKGVIYYTTFDKNDAEYIGASDQYADSKISKNFTFDDSPRHSWFYADQAKKEWADVGMNVVDQIQNFLGPVVAKKLANVIVATASAQYHNSNQSLSDSLGEAAVGSSQTVALGTASWSNYSNYVKSGNLSGIKPPTAVTPIAVPLPRRFKPRLPVYAGG